MGMGDADPATRHFWSTVLNLTADYIPDLITEAPGLSLSIVSGGSALHR